MHFNLRYAIAFIGAILSASAHAFDPFTIVSVAGTAASAVSGLTDAASEVTSVTDSFTELYSEIDPDSEVSNDGRHIIEQIREIESLARDAGYSVEEINDLMKTDKRELEGLASTMRTLTRAIRTGKRVAKLFTRLEKKSQMAQIESTAIQREQLKVQYKLLNAQLEENLLRKKEDLKKQIEKKKQIEAYHKEILNRGGRVVGRAGLYTFPKIDKVVEKALQLATRMRGVFITLVLLVFLIRVVFYQFGLFGIDRYGDLLRDVMICLLLMCAFPAIINAAMGISDHIAKKIAGGSLNTGTTLPEAPEISVTNLSRSFVQTVVWLGMLLKYSAFVIADFIFNFGIAFLVLLFPLVIFMSQMMNFSLAWPLFLGSFVLLSLWPFFWNGAALLAAELWTMDKATLSDQLKTILFTALQFVSPFVTMAVLKGEGLAGAIKGAANPARRVLSNATQTFSGASASVKGVSRIPKNAQPSYRLGRALGNTVFTPAREVHGRVQSALSSAQKEISRQREEREPLLGSSVTPVKKGRVLQEGLKGFAFPEKRKSSSRFKKGN